VRPVLPKSVHLWTDIQFRAKRYERLLKAKGINPNGGPDPNPSPPSTRKVTKHKPKDDTANARPKRRKIGKTAEKKAPEPTAATEGNSCAAVSSSSSPASRLSISTPYKPCYQLPPSPNEELTFDFNDFCSPEMFAQCAPDTRHLAPRDQSVPSSIPAVEMTAFGHGLGTPPQLVRGERKWESKPDRETVIIAD
jgi:hypothetical protein